MLERFIELQAGLLPADRLMEGPVVYQYLTEEDFADSGVCSGGIACAQQGVVFTPDGVDLHEITHAVRQRAYAGSLPGPLILEEGWASLFSDAYIGNTRQHLAYDDLAATSEWDNIMGEQYPAAAHLLNFLADRLGYEGVARFLDAGEAINGPEDYDEVYRASTGRNWAEDWASYGGTPICESWATVHRPIECSSPSRVVDFSVDNFHRVDFDAFSCGHADATGPTQGLMWGSFALDMPTDLDGSDVFLDFSVVPPIDVDFQVVSCEQRCATDGHSFRNSEGERSVRMPVLAGRTLVRFGMDPAAEVDIQVQVVQL